MGISGAQPTCASDQHVQNAFPFGGFGSSTALFPLELLAARSCLRCSCKYMSMTLMLWQCQTPPLPSLRMRLTGARPLNSKKRTP
eukprot:2593522-Pleurochrysis_carterae.AAC.2